MNGILEMLFLFWEFVLGTSGRSSVIYENMDWISYRPLRVLNCGSPVFYRFNASTSDSDPFYICYITAGCSCSGESACHPHPRFVEAVFPDSHHQATAKTQWRVMEYTSHNPGHSTESMVPNGKDVKTSVSHEGGSEGLFEGGKPGLNATYLHQSSIFLTMKKPTTISILMI